MKSNKEKNLTELLQKGKNVEALYSEAHQRFKVKYSKKTGVASAQYVKNLDDAIAKCNIDLSIWEVYKYEVLNHPVYRKEVDQDMIFEEGKITGYKIDRGNITIESLVNIKLYIRLRQFNADLFIQKLTKKLSETPVNFKAIKYPKDTNNNLLVVNLYDLHLDKLAFDSQVGETITPEETRALAETAIHYLLQRAEGYSFQRILLPVGHDFFNHDRILGYAMTTRETPQHSALNWEALTIYGGELFIQIIDRLVQIAPVDIYAVPGNHDANRSWHIAHYLSAWYRNHKSISVELLGGVRKYYRWGQNLIGMTHTVKGAQRKQRLRSAMTNERKNDWAETKYRYWLLGDLHRESSEDVDGVVFEVLPSLAANDLWHHEQAFAHMRTCKGLIYNKDHGLIGTVMYNLDID